MFAGSKKENTATMNKKDEDAGYAPDTPQDLVEEELTQVTVDLGPDDSETQPFIAGHDVPPPKKPKVEKTSQQKLMAVVFYWITSLSLVFLNKFVMSWLLFFIGSPHYL
eukprot:299037_1